MSLSKGIDNIKRLSNPIDVLKDQLSRALIIKNQKLEFNKIYTKCLASDNFEYINTSDNDSQYKLVLDLLMINKQGFKILVSESMIGLLLSHTHLLGHLGVNKMINNLQSYYFQNMYTTVKKFVMSCYLCFLCHGRSRKNKLGVYPIPEYPFAEISMDLCENLNAVGGYCHLLIIQDVLTDLF